jgi:predicted Na+-dependent transporter
VLALVGTVAVATLLSCQGMSASMFHALGSFAVASLFLLQWARLSRAAQGRGSRALATPCGGNPRFLAAALLIMISGSRTLRFDRADESAIVFCGSQKSVVSGIPTASALIADRALGLFVLPIMTRGRNARS